MTKKVVLTSWVVRA